MVSSYDFVGKGLRSYAEIVFLRIMSLSVASAAPGIAIANTHRQGEAPSPAQMEEMYAKFNAWREKFQENIVDIGGKLNGGGKIVTSEGATDGPEGATDGPFVEAKEVIGGYMIVSAESMEEAVEVARQSPGVAMPGSSVEVREISTP